MRYGSRSPRLSPHDAARSSRAPSIAREHPTVIEGYDISFTVKRGELTTVRLTADKPGVSGSAAGSTSHRWSAS